MPSKKFRKAILKVGKYHSPDGEVDVTPERLNHWSKQFRRMKGRNLVVPIDWDHAADASEATPLSHDSFKNRSAKNTVGKLDQFNLSKDGASAEIILDVHDESAQAKASDNSVYVSPVIFNKWRDGQGKEYNDCITHVDFVNHPVDASQSPFEPVEEGAIACAIRMSLSDDTDYQVFRLAMEDDDEEDDDAADDTADSDTDSEESDMADDDKTTDEGMSDDSGEVQGGEVKSLVNDVLSRIGAEVPTDFDPMSEDGLKLVMTAIMNHLSGKESEEASNDEPADDDDFGGGGDDLVEATPDLAALSLSVKRQEKLWEKKHRLSLHERLAALVESGRCSPHEKNQQAKQANKVRLSLDSSGEFKTTKLEEWITSREQLPKGAVWDPYQRLSSASEVPPPSMVDDGELSDEKVDAIIGDVFKKPRMARANAAGESVKR